MTMTSSPALASDKQVEFLLKLLQERRYTDDISVEDQVAKVIVLHTGRQFGKRAASSMIESALRAPRREASKPPIDDLEDGFYHLDGQIFKVLHAVHGSGRQYAKVLDFETGHFEFAQGAIRNLVRWGEKLSLEKAKELGTLYGRCAICGATLTDEESIARGIGPVCARRF